MRKKTIKYLCDNVLWYLIYLLPLIFAVVHWYKIGVVDIAGVFALGGFELVADNIIFTCLNSIFGATGVVPLFADTGLLLYFSYFIICWIVHLAVDVLLFIVRWSHSMLDGFLGGKHD